MNLFYAPDLTLNTDFYLFDKDESRHIIKSLRKKDNDKLFLTNGMGGWFVAKIIDANPKQTRIKILSHQQKSASSFNIHIAMAPTKSNERYEWFLEKATEIGINEITPIVSRYSERKKINKARWNKILVSAMKQSLQAYKPRLNDLMNLDDFINKDFGAAQKLMAYCQAEDTLSSTISSVQNILILIGPEGGFSDFEVQKAKAAGFITATISPNRLRTETAGLVSLMTAHFKLESLPKNK